MPETALCPCPVRVPWEGGAVLRQRLPCRGGELLLTCYPLFPGISLTYRDVHAAAWEAAGEAGCLTTHHCREGRMEYRVDGRAYCLAAGDMAGLTRWEGETCFPTGHYHGVTVTLDPTRAPDCLSCFLEDVDVRPQALMDRYCREGGCFVARSSPRVEHIFSELYTVPEGIRRGYLSVKLLELLLALSVWEGEPRPGGTPAQTRLVGEAEALLQDRPEERWTLARLSQRLGASPSLLQGSFRAVYGMSPGAFLRARRMRYAAELLRRSDESVLAIAGQLGYDNASKFARAFRQVMGVSPSDYRRGPDSCAPGSVHSGGDPLRTERKERGEGRRMAPSAKDLSQMVSGS